MNIDEKNSNDSLPYKLLACVTNSWMAQAVYVAAELKIADFLKKGSKTSQELAAATNTHAPSLNRLLRALCSVDICKELKDGSFEITQMGSLLRTGTTESLRS